MVVVAGLTTKASTEELLRLTEELLRLKEELKLKEELLKFSGLHKQRKKRGGRRRMSTRRWRSLDINETNIESWSLLRRRSWKCPS